MKKLIAVLSPIALSLTLVSLPATAGKGHGQYRGMHSVLKQLDLSEQQKQDIRQTFSQSREDRAVYREDMRGLKEELKQYIHSDSWNEAAIRELLSQQEAMLSTLQLQQAQKKHAVWNLLTAEQQQQWQQVKAKQKARWQQKKQSGKKRKSKLERLNLTQEQQSSLEQLRAEMQTQKQNFKADYESFRQAQRAIVEAESFDQQAWQQLWQQNQPLLVNIAISKAQYRFNVWNLLTGEQQQALSAMKGKGRFGKKQRG